MHMMSFLMAEIDTLDACGHRGDRDHVGEPTMTNRGESRACGMA